MSIITPCIFEYYWNVVHKFVGSVYFINALTFGLSEDNQLLLKNILFKYTCNS